MPTPVSERIAVVVRDRLAAISTGSGYETTTSGVVRPTRQGGFQPKDYQIVLNQGDQVPNDALSCPGNPPAIAWDFPFEINGILRPSEKLTTAIDTLKNEFSADITKALNTGTAWWNMGGIALNSKLSGVTDYESSDGAEGGFQVVLTVTYRTDENDPYTVRA